MLNNAGSPIDAIVIGCGQIAGGYDEKVGGNAVLSHAGGYRAHPGFRLTACVEPNDARRQAFMAHWNVPHGFATLDACLEAGVTFQVASVCTPTHTHAAILERLLQTPCRAVLCEKPLTDSREETLRLGRAYADAGRALLVNFRRCFLPSLQAVRKRIADGELGRLLWGVGWYGKGTLHNGGHMLNLMEFLAGPLRPVMAFGAIPDHFDDDPSVSAVLITEDGAHLHMLASDCRAYHLFELTLGFERGVLAFEEDGAVLDERPVTTNPLYPHHQYVGGAQRCEMDLDRAMYWAIDELWRASTQGGDVHCDATHALSAQSLGESLLRMVRENKEPSE